MASVAASGIFNALAFAGAGFLFKSLDKNGYEDEMKRHNLAMEKLTAAKEKLYENQVEKKNEMELLLQQLSDANADINKTNKAFDNLRKITFENRTFTREPHRTVRRNERISTRRGRIGRSNRRVEDLQINSIFITFKKL